MRTVLLWVALVALAALCSTSAACARSSDPPFKPTATVDQLMIGPIQHAAQAYWNAVSTVIDKDGITETAPKTDQEWADLWSNGIAIAESGNLLMMGSRARDDGDWMRLSAALVDAGMKAATAAESKDAEDVLAKGEAIYTVCTECHMRYISMD